VGRPGDGDDVRGAILAAALRQLEATGSPDRVTVAAIVAEAGCTPPSLYHYWSHRELLLQEASAYGWAQFRASQSDAVTGRDDANPDLGGDLGGDVGGELNWAPRQDPVERLRLRGRAYLEFALARPSLFRVLFLEPSTGPGGSPAQTGKALEDLVIDVKEAMASGQLRPADPLTTALALWSAMHGVAALWAATPGLPVELAHAVGDLAQDALLAGLASSSPECSPTVRG
jgi:AcrR family transcriptional regulator